jgi:hypothetical protein
VWLSTEGVISSFEALLSTDLSGSYSQGLINRKSTKWLFPGAKKTATERSVTIRKPIEGYERAIVRERNRG